MILQKRWVRVLISVLSGGILQELLRIRSGRDLPAVSFFVAIVMYGILSIGVHYYSLFILQRKVDKEQDRNEELIDDLD